MKSVSWGTPPEVGKKIDSEYNPMGASVNLAFGAGYLINTQSAIGFGKVHSISTQIFLFTLSVDIIFTCAEHWGHIDKCSFSGLGLSAGIAWPTSFNIDVDTALTYAGVIKNEAEVKGTVDACQGQRWRIEIDTKHKDLNHEEQAGPLGVYIFRDIDEYYQSGGNSPLPFKDGTGLGYKVPNNLKCGYGDHLEWEVTTEYRPYGVQIVNWGTDDVYIDNVKLVRLGMGLLNGDEYDWGGNNGNGWVISSNMFVPEYKEGRTDCTKGQRQFFGRACYRKRTSLPSEWQKVARNPGIDNSLVLSFRDPDGFDMRRIYHSPDIWYKVLVDSGHNRQWGEESSTGVEVWMDNQWKETFSEYGDGHQDEIEFKHKKDFKYIDIRAKGRDVAFIDWIRIRSYDREGGEECYANDRIHSWSQGLGENGEGYCISTDNGHSIGRSYYCKYSQSYHGWRFYSDKGKSPVPLDEDGNPVPLDEDGNVYKS